MPAHFAILFGYRNDELDDSLVQYWCEWDLELDRLTFDFAFAQIGDVDNGEERRDGLAAHGRSLARGHPLPAGLGHGTTQLWLVSFCPAIFVPDGYPIFIGYPGYPTFFMPGHRVNKMVPCR